MTMDQVTTEIVRATFNAAAERMRITMIRTAYNTVISEALDFGCAMFDPAVQMIAQGTGVPIFQGHLGFPIKAMLRLRDISEIYPGDIFIHNDPYDGGGNHLNDVAMFSPVFRDDILAGWVAVKAHWIDIGGSVPSSILNNSTDFRQEGLRFQGVRLCLRGELNDEVMRVICSNIRLDTSVPKDINAMMAVCRVGETYFQEILAKYGAKTVAEATRIFMDQSEKRTRAELMKIPSGSYHAVGYFDNDGIDLETPVRIEVSLTVEGGSITIDCTGSSSQVKGPFNCGDAITNSAGRLILRCLTLPFEPADEGAFRPLRVIIPPGSVLSAHEPAPSARYYVPINLFIELSLRALASALPERIPAGAFADQMPSFFIGTDPQSGQGFVQGDAHAGGTGGRPHRDGESGMSIVIGSTSQNNPVEVVESRNPTLRILRYALRQDSGGAGKYRGGLGLERVYQFNVPTLGIFTLERKVTPPMGLKHGQNGAVNQINVIDATGRSREVRKATLLEIPAGETISVRTGGGGGLGNPAERDPEAIRLDLKEGYISDAAAHLVYCVKKSRQ